MFTNNHWVMDYKSTYILFLGLFIIEIILFVVFSMLKNSLTILSFMKIMLKKNYVLLKITLE